MARGISKKFTKTSAKLRELFCLEVPSKNLKARKALLETHQWEDEKEDQEAVQSAKAAKITVLGLLQGRVREKFALQLSSPLSSSRSPSTVPSSGSGASSSSSPATSTGPKPNACSSVEDLKMEVHQAVAQLERLTSVIYSMKDMLVAKLAKYTKVLKNIKLLKKAIGPSAKNIQIDDLVVVSSSDEEADQQQKKGKKEAEEEEGDEEDDTQEDALPPKRRKSSASEKSVPGASPAKKKHKGVEQPTLLSKLSPRVSLKTADLATATATDTAANSAPSLPRRLAAHGVAAATVAEQENAAEEDDEPELSPLDVPATATCSSSSSSSTSAASVCAAERALAQQRLLHDVSQALPTKKKNQGDTEVESEQARKRW